MLQDLVPGPCSAAKANAIRTELFMNHVRTGLLSGQGAPPELATPSQASAEESVGQLMEPHAIPRNPVRENQDRADSNPATERSVETGACAVLKNLTSTVSEESRTQALIVPVHPMDNARKRRAYEIEETIDGACPAHSQISTCTVDIQEIRTTPKCGRPDARCTSTLVECSPSAPAAGVTKTTPVELDRGTRLIFDEPIEQERLAAGRRVGSRQ